LREELPSTRASPLYPCPARVDERRDVSQRFQQSLSATQRQDMRLLPRMVQSVEILALPAVELESYLLEAFEGNEALALVDEGWTPRARAEAPPGRGGAAGRAASDRHEAWLESQPARDGGLVEQALAQLSMRAVDPALAPWVELVIGALDPRGYLEASDESLLAQAGEQGLAGGAAELGRAIAVLQSLEPRGIGGRNAIEALLLQLDPGDPDYALLCVLLEDFLEDVARNKLPAVAKAMGLELGDLRALLERLRELELRPAAMLADEAAPAIVPDVLVLERDGGFEVQVDGSGLLPMRVDPDVRALSRDRRLDADVRRHLKSRIDQARWLMQAVQHRKETLHRVATAVFAHQERFLRDGPEGLRALRMGDVAGWLGIHVSTVSRAVAGKHAQTPWGVLPLRWFFQAPGGSGASAGGGDAARDRVRDLVGELVAAEDKAQPLSDEALQAALAARGYEVARRTVAKYRSELEIPSSYRRRRYA
jgi:RNA polymerase sigma-54 factor